MGHVYVLVCWTSRRSTPCPDLSSKLHPAEWLAMCPCGVLLSTGAAFILPSSPLHTTHAPWASVRPLKSQHCRNREIGTQACVITRSHFRLDVKKRSIEVGVDYDEQQAVGGDITVPPSLPWCFTGLLGVSHLLFIFSFSCLFALKGSSGKNFWKRSGLVCAKVIRSSF